MDVAKGFLSISGILQGGQRVVKEETDVSTFPGTYSKLSGWPGSFHSCSAQSLLPGTSRVKAPFEIDQGAEKHLGFGKDAGPVTWLKHHVCSGDIPLITPGLGAAILCGESILGGHHYVFPPMPPPCLHPCMGFYTQRAFSGSQLSGFLNWNALSLSSQLHQQGTRRQYPPRRLGDLHWRYKLLFRWELEIGPLLLFPLLHQ